MGKFSCRAFCRILFPVITQPLPQKDFFSSLEFITLINCLYYEYVNGGFVFSPG